MRRSTWARHPRLLVRVLLIACGLATSARGATVIVAGEREPLRGYVVEQRAAAIVIELEGGRRREIARDQIEELIRPVSEERLAALTPDQPHAYRDYAEELAEKRADPEARDMATRLYVIAAYLAPDELGCGCLLGMASLAKTPERRRLLRAMAYVLDPAHSRSLLVEAPTPVREGNRQQARKVLQHLRSLRRTEARALLADAGVAEALASLRSGLTMQDVDEALSPVCTHCAQGQVPCKECGGTGKVERNGRTVDCLACRSSSGGGRGKVPCPHCRGEYRNPVQATRLLVKLLAAEQELLAPDSSTKRAEGEGAFTTATALGPAIPDLRLETLTPYDPRRSVYRNGEWREPPAR